METQVGGNAKTKAVKSPTTSRATTYAAKDRNEVCIGGKTVARMYVQADGKPELRILQGMPRDATVQKLLADCPGFCEQNNITGDTYPLLFAT